MIENLQEKLHQGKRKQSKGAKICASIWWELSEKNAPKLCRIFERQTMQNQSNGKHVSKAEVIYK